MKLLLDECVPAILRFDLAEHQVQTVTRAGFSGFKNGKLLAAIAGNFDVLITVDKSISKQQNLEKLFSFKISILLLRSRTSRYDDLKILMPQALEALEWIKIGEVVEIESAKN